MISKGFLNTKSHLKNRILVQVQGGTESQPADILKYFEELKLDPNTEIGTKGLFEMASNTVPKDDKPCLDCSRYSF